MQKCVILHVVQQDNLGERFLITTYRCRISLVEWQKKKGKRLMSEFVKALLGCQGTSKIPEEYDWFAPLLGDWDFDYYDLQDGRRTRHVEGEWLFRRALDGTGIEDLFICPSRNTRESNPQPDGEYGAALRMYNPATKVYDMVYTTSGSMTLLQVQRENGQIVCTVVSDVNAKWVFDEVTGDTFHWKNVTVMDDGHWRTNCEVVAVRKKKVDYGSVYEDCPVFDNGKYCLRLVGETDAKDLLAVYADEKAVPFFNSDNCHGDTFHYTSLERMPMEAVKEILVGNGYICMSEEARRISFNRGYTNAKTRFVRHYTECAKKHIYRLEQCEAAAPVFGNWQETIIWSCLQHVMGHVYADDRNQPASAMAVLGDFFFLRAYLMKN